MSLTDFPETLRSNALFHTHPFSFESIFNQVHLADNIYSYIILLVIIIYFLTLRLGQRITTLRELRLLQIQQI